MKSLALVVALLSFASVGLAQEPAHEAAKPEAQAKQKETNPAPAAAMPKADDPKPVHREERPDGLIIEDFVIGAGAVVEPGAVVVAHYRGTFKDNGNEFDSSYKRGEPVAFPLKGVIKGWQDGIPGMKVGGKRRLTVPFALAYGEQGRPGIPPKADLVFDVELVDTLIKQDVKEGDGAAFQLGESPKIRYTIKKAGNGEVVAKSDDAGDTINFRLMLMGFQFGLDGMKEHGKRKLMFPALMAWQQKPAPLPADTKLECEVELISAKSDSEH